MEQNIITIVSLIIIGIGILGTFLPVLPGLAVSFVGLILYKYGANPDFSIWYIVIFGILTLISLVLNYIIPIKTTEIWWQQLRKIWRFHRDDCRFIFSTTWFFLLVCY